MSLFRKEEHEYSQLADTDSEKSQSQIALEQQQPVPRKSSSNLRAFLLGSLWFALGIICTVGVQLIAREVKPYNPLAPDTIPHTFHYDRNFSYPPSEHTNHAWRSIFPEEGGFFVNPDIAPTRATFSVFHQLHCVNGLRGGYWANHRAALAGEKLRDEDLPVDIQESHMRHCIDLLRQALMCHGDTTLEVVDESINGVHGFRVEHQCIDWDRLKEWTSVQQRRQHVEQIV